MRVLTVRQPWAWAIIHGGKDVENRTRNIAGDYRGPVAIHTSLTFESEALHNGDLLAAMLREGGDTPGAHAMSRNTRGVVIGVVDLVDVHESVDCWPSGFRAGTSPESWHCSSWAQPEAHHLVLANPRALATPVPARGKLGLWRPDAELLAALAEQGVAA